MIDPQLYALLRWFSAHHELLFTMGPMTALLTAMVYNRAAPTKWPRCQTWMAFTFVAMCGLMFLYGLAILIIKSL